MGRYGVESRRIDENKIGANRDNVSGSQQFHCRGFQSSACGESNYERVFRQRPRQRISLPVRREDLPRVDIGERMERARNIPGEMQNKPKKFEDGRMRSSRLHGFAHGFVYEALGSTH